MGEAGLAGLFVLGTDVVPDSDGHDRRLAVLVDDDPQAVVEHEPLVGDLYVRLRQGQTGQYEQHAGGG